MHEFVDRSAVASDHVVPKVDAERDQNTVQIQILCL